MAPAAAGPAGAEPNPESQDACWAAATPVCCSGHPLRTTAAPKTKPPADGIAACKRPARRRQNQRAVLARPRRKSSPKNTSKMAFAASLAAAALGKAGLVIQAFCCRESEHCSKHWYCCFAQAGQKNYAWWLFAKICPYADNGGAVKKIRERTAESTKTTSLAHQRHWSRVEWVADNFQDPDGLTKA